MKMIKISEIFDIKVGTNLDYIDTNERIKNPILYVSRQTGNHGVKDIVENNMSIVSNEKLTISVPLGGSGRLTAHLQPFEYFSGQNMFILKPKQPLSIQILLFYCLVIRKNKFKYSGFGREANSTFSSLNVPDLNSLPDFVNKNEILNLLNLNYSFTKITSLNSGIDNLDDKKKWRLFNILDIFTIVKGKNISEEVAKELGKGDISFVSATEKNNGVKFNINMENNTIATVFEPGQLSLAKNGNVCKVFYQYKYFVTTSDVLVLKCKFKELSLYEGIFFKYMIEKSKYRFNYGRKINSNRIKEINFKLPVKEEGCPDFELIKNFIKKFKELKKFI